MAHFSRGPWHAEIRKTRAGHRQIQVRNTSRDAVAIVYTTEDDARLMAASLKLFAMVKCLVRVFAHDGDRTDAQAAALAKAQKLIDEVEGV